VRPSCWTEPASPQSSTLTSAGYSFCCDPSASHRVILNDRSHPAFHSAASRAEARWLLSVGGLVCVYLSVYLPHTRKPAERRVATIPTLYLFSALWTRTTPPCRDHARTATACESRITDSNPSYLRHLSRGILRHRPLSLTLYVASVTRCSRSASSLLSLQLNVWSHAILRRGHTSSLQLHSLLLPARPFVQLSICYIDESPADPQAGPVFSLYGLPTELLRCCCFLPDEFGWRWLLGSVYESPTLSSCGWCRLFIGNAVPWCG